MKHSMNFVYNKNTENKTTLMQYFREYEINIKRKTYRMQCFRFFYSFIHSDQYVIEIHANVFMQHGFTIKLCSKCESCERILCTVLDSFVRGQHPIEL